MAKINLVVELESDEEGNLLEDLKENDKEDKILQMLIDARSKQGPASVLGWGPGEQQYVFSFKAPIDELRKL